MIERRSDSGDRKTIKEIRRKKKEKIFPSGCQNHLRFSSLNNEIFLSPSGQAKIDNLDSCLSLDESDFIVF